MHHAIQGYHMSQVPPIPCDKSNTSDRKRYITISNVKEALTDIISYEKNKLSEKIYTSIGMEVLMVKH